MNCGVLLPPHSQSAAVLATGGLAHPSSSARSCHFSGCVRRPGKYAPISFLKLSNPASPSGHLRPPPPRTHHAPRLRICLLQNIVVLVTAPSTLSGLTRRTKPLDLPSKSAARARVVIDRKSSTHRIHTAALSHLSTFGRPLPCQSWPRSISSFSFPFQHLAHHVLGTHQATDFSLRQRKVFVWSHRKYHRGHSESLDFARFSMHSSSFEPTFLINLPLS